MTTLPRAQTTPPLQPQSPTRTAQSYAQPAFQTDPLVHSLDDQSQSGRSAKPLLFLFVMALIIIAAGGGTGYLLANMSGTGGTSSDSPEISAPEGSTVVSKSGEEGIKDDQLFPDEAEGMLQVNDGAITKEGTHMLIREGGPDKTAFLTSSVVDLTKYEGKKVSVRGQTLSSQTAGWFMDVGWIKEL